MEDNTKYIEIKHEYAQVAVRYQVLTAIRYLDKTPMELCARLGVDRDKLDAICRGEVEFTYAEMATLIYKLIGCNLRVIIDWEHVMHITPGKDARAVEQCDVLWKEIQEVQSADRRSAGLEPAEGG